MASVYRAPLVDLTSPVPREDSVVEPLAAMVNREAPVEVATMKIGVVVLLSKLVPWTTNIAVGVEELMPILELALTTRIELVEEEAMFRMSLPPLLPCKLKVTVEEVALMPATVPLSLIRPLEIALVPLPMRLKPGAKVAAPVPPLATARVPVKLGMKVRVLAVVVEMEITMLVSEEVAT